MANNVDSRFFISSSIHITAAHIPILLYCWILTYIYTHSCLVWHFADTISFSHIPRPKIWWLLCVCDHEIFKSNACHIPNLIICNHHELPTPNEGINQKNLKIWTIKFGSGSWFLQCIEGNQYSLQIIRHFVETRSAVNHRKCQLKSWIE